VHTTGGHNAGGVNGAARGAAGRKTVTACSDVEPTLHVAPVQDMPPTSPHRSRVRLAPTNNRLPTAAELRILRALWELKAATAGHLYRYLGRECYNTILTHLRHLYGKQLVDRVRDGKAHVYSATIDQWSLLTAIARHLRDIYFEESGTTLAVCALTDTIPARASLATLKQIIRDKERGAPTIRG
jgi:predicted transcriptional regulator